MIFKFFIFFFVLCLVAVCLTSADENVSETGRRYPSRTKHTNTRNRNDGVGDSSFQQADAAYYSSMDQQVHPEQDEARDQHFSDWNGPSYQDEPAGSSYYQTSYTQRPLSSNKYYYSPQSKQEYGGGGGSSYSYSYEGKGSDKGHHKGGGHGDLIWDLIGKKSKLEKAFWDFVASCIPDWVWKSKFGHGHGSSSSTPQKGYGYGGDHDAEKGLSKEDIFHKVKLLAITATALLGTLGGGILAAPLLIGKGRSLSSFLPDQVKMDELTQLADRVLQAIQAHKQ